MLRRNMFVVCVYLVSQGPDLWGCVV